MQLQDHLPHSARVLRFSPQQATLHHQLLPGGRHSTPSRTCASTQVCRMNLSYQNFKAMDQIISCHRNRPNILEKLMYAFSVLKDYWQQGSNLREMNVVKALLTVLEFCGDFNTQSRIIRLLAAKEYVSDFPDTFPKVWFSQMNQTETAFLELLEKNDHLHSRAVMNFYNSEKELSYVYSVKCITATWNGAPLHPIEGEFWLDLNCGSATLSMCVEDVPTEVKDASYQESLVIPGSGMKKIEALSFYSPNESLYHEVTVTSDRGNLTILLDTSSQIDWERINEFIYFIAKLKLQTNFLVTSNSKKELFQPITSASSYSEFQALQAFKEEATGGDECNNQNPPNYVPSGSSTFPIGTFMGREGNGSVFNRDGNTNSSTGSNGYNQHQQQSQQQNNSEAAHHDATWESQTIVSSEERVTGNITTEIRSDGQNGETQGRISYEMRGECFPLPYNKDDVEGNVTLQSGDKVSFQNAAKPCNNLGASHVRLENPAHPVGYQGVVCSMKERADVVQHDPSKDDRTIFINNLPFSAGEDQITEVFSSVGTISEISFPKTINGKPKGCAYVVFSSYEEASEALKKDRELIGGWPVFVSKCLPDRKNRQHACMFSKKLERNKLFVKGLPIPIIQKDVQPLFEPFGTLKSVTFPRRRNFKGIAFVEYEDEVSAALARAKVDGMIMGDRRISVAILELRGCKKSLNRKMNEPSTSFSWSL